MSLDNTDTQEELSTEEVDIALADENAEPENGDAITEAGDEGADSENATDNNAGETDNSFNDWRHNPEVHKAIAAAKKHGYEKGRSEGVGSNDNGQAQQQAQYQQQPQQPQYSQEQVQLQARVNQTNAQGYAKYQDWEQKVTPVAEIAHFDPETNAMMHAALQLPNSADAIYKIATDYKLQEKLRRVNPRYMMETLKEALETQEAKKPTVVVKKTAHAPVDDIKAPPAKSGGKMTYEDRVKAAKERQRAR